MSRYQDFYRLLAGATVLTGGLVAVGAAPVGATPDDSIELEANCTEVETVITVTLAFGANPITGIFVVNYFDGTTSIGSADSEPFVLLPGVQLRTTVPTPVDVATIWTQPGTDAQCSLETRDLRQLTDSEVAAIPPITVVPLTTTAALTTTTAPTECVEYTENWTLPLVQCDAGAAVAAVQSRLSVAGFITYDLFDGSLCLFEPRVTAALRGFQTGSGLSATGEVDQATWDALGIDDTWGNDFNGNGAIDPDEMTGSCDLTFAGAGVTAGADVSLESDGTCGRNDESRHLDSQANWIDTLTISDTPDLIDCQMHISWWIESVLILDYLPGQNWNDSNRSVCVNDLDGMWVPLPHTERAGCSIDGTALDRWRPPASTQ